MVVTIVTPGADLRAPLCLARSSLDRPGAQEAVPKDSRGQRPDEDPRLGEVGGRRIGERQPGDEQRAGEPDPGEDREAEDLGPADQSGKRPNAESHRQPGENG